MPITSQARVYAKPNRAGAGGGAQNLSEMLSPKPAYGAMGGQMGQGQAQAPVQARGTTAQASSPYTQAPLSQQAPAQTPQMTQSHGTPQDTSAYPGVPGSTGTTPYGYPQFTGKNKLAKKMSKWQKRMLQNAPPWMQDQEMFQQATGQIGDLLGSKGAVSPEEQIMQQADIMKGGQQSQDAIRARLSAAGVSLDDPSYQMYLGLADQGTNQLFAGNRRANELQRYQRQLQNLQLTTPYLQAMLGLAGPKGAGGVTAAPISQMGGGTDWGGMAGQLGAGFLQGYGSTL